MNLKPQDIVILIKIISMFLDKKPHEELSNQNISSQLFIGIDEVRRGVKRLHLSNLIHIRTASYGEDVFSFVGLGQYRPEGAPVYIPSPIIQNCEEFLISAVKFMVPAQYIAYGSETVGIARYDVFKDILMPGKAMVWPYKDGRHKGIGVKPIYKTVPQSIDKYPDEKFYYLLSLVDEIRTGRARERYYAKDLLEVKLCRS